MSAIISDDGFYRYHLARGQAYGTTKTMLFVMLNPSTADVLTDDPTIRRCWGFAKREACWRLEVVNVYAMRTTDPAKLWTSGRDPVGPDNGAMIKKAAVTADVVVCAWGANVKANDAKMVQFILREAHAEPKCLGLTKAGQPRHPLYVRGDAPLQPFGV